MLLEWGGKGFLLSIFNGVWAQNGFQFKSTRMKQSSTLLSLVSRPHPAHRRSGLVSQAAVLKPYNR